MGVLFPFQTVAGLPWVLRLVDIASAGLAIAMVVALATAWRSGSPRWLLALAAVASGIAVVRLLRSYTTVTPPTGVHVSYPWQAYILNVALVVLAFGCAVVGLIRWYRVPSRSA